jgi:hypothetical protein
MAIYANYAAMSNACHMSVPTCMDANAAMLAHYICPARVLTVVLV